MRMKLLGLEKNGTYWNILNGINLAGGSSDFSLPSALSKAPSNRQRGLLHCLGEAVCRPRSRSWSSGGPHVPLQSPGFWLACSRVQQSRAISVDKGLSPLLAE